MNLGISRSAASTVLPDHIPRTIPIDDDHFFNTVCHASGTCLAFTDAAAVSVVGHSLESDGDLLLKKGDHRELVLERLGPPNLADEDVLIYNQDNEIRMVLVDGQLEWVQLSVLPNQLGNLHWMAHDYFSLQPEFDPEGTQLIINTTYPAEDFRTTGISHDGKLLINCQGANATPRERVHQILGAPRFASEAESIWMYKNITDMNRDWKPHAEMDVLVVKFDQNGLAKGIETDFETLMKMAEELKSNSTPGD